MKLKVALLLASLAASAVPALCQTSIPLQTVARKHHKVKKHHRVKHRA